VRPAVKNRYTFRLDEIQALARRQRLQTQMIARLQKTIEEHEILLNTALQELALARGEKSPARFIRFWVRDHQRLDKEGMEIG
jgi:hypothetical protein